MDDDGTDDTVGRDREDRTITTKETREGASNDIPQMVTKDVTHTKCNQEIRGDNVCVERCRKITFHWDGYAHREKEKGNIYYQMCADADE